ncbi:MAG: hypothetical protein KGH49_03790 [Candidatus Micrarchaeota archaeon]|nr:hypothetical protein [Candidatus Micrarchaeota archaeon]
MQKPKGQKYEFRILCRDEEACKRVRFGMETGLVFVATDDVVRIWTEGVPKKPTKNFQECGHEIPEEVLAKARRNTPLSSEVGCGGCGTTMTIIPGKFKPGHSAVAVVDFEHYDDYPGKGQTVKIIVDKCDCPKRA